MFTLIFYMFLVFIINIPFGYWRANVKKFSIQWFLAVHTPVPFVGYLRHNIEFDWVSAIIVFFVFAYFGGQLFGARLWNSMRQYGPVSSSLIHDLIRRSWIIIIGR